MANRTITAKLNFQSDFLQTFDGQYLIKLSSPAGHFAPFTNPFTVTNFPYAQRFTGTVASNDVAISNTIIILFPANQEPIWSSPFHWQQRRTKKNARVSPPPAVRAKKERDDAGHPVRDWAADQAVGGCFLAALAAARAALAAALASGDGSGAAITPKPQSPSLCSWPRF